MKNMKKTGLLLFVVAIIILGFSVVSFADTTVITTGHAPYFHTGAGPVASIFYWIGDIIVLPFRLIGDLFAGI